MSNKPFTIGVKKGGGEKAITLGLQKKGSKGKPFQTGVNSTGPKGQAITTGVDKGGDKQGVGRIGVKKGSQRGRNDVPTQRGVKRPVEPNNVNSLKSLLKNKAQKTNWDRVRATHKKQK